VQLSVVYGREIDGKATSFGTTGYTYNNTFLLYDRSTDSVWYPQESKQMNAVSGSNQGHSLPFLAEPTPQPLAEWHESHPDSLVLIGNQ